MRSHLHSALLLCLTLACQCSLSPQPEPPNVTPKIDPGALVGHPESPAASIRPTIVGNPGSIVPPEGKVWVVNLDQTEDPAVGNVEPDGSFLVDIRFMEGDELRIQVLGVDTRSEPIDIIAGGDGSAPLIADRALESCLFLTPATELELSPEPSPHGIIVLRSTCPNDVVVSAPRLRRAVPGFEAGAGFTWPTTLTSGASLSMSVIHGGTGPGDLEEILFVEATSPTSDRRPITVRGWMR